jgi:hypothetical protein
MESELDVENVEKILEAAQQIEDMAKTRPEQAAEMLQRARYLVNLAEQIKRDWLNRFATVPPGTVAQALSRAIPARAEPLAGEQTAAEFQGAY